MGLEQVAETGLELEAEATIEVQPMHGLTDAEVARLGADLTPMGAEKAGNKDGTIPAYRAMPAGGKNLPTVLVVQEIFLTKTAQYAHVVLPATSFAEKEGTFVNTDRHIQLSDAAVPPPGAARPDLEILIDLSNRLGLPTRWSGPADVMAEIASVTPYTSVCQPLASPTSMAWR